MASLVTLQFNDINIDGWNSMSLTHSYENLAAGFQLSLSDSWTKPPRPVKTGEAVKLLLEGKPALEGYINMVKVQYDKAKFIVTVSGRDKLGDLVDCTSDAKEYKDMSFYAIAQDICNPFGIKVFDELVGNTPFKSFAIEPGDTAHQSLQELAKQRAALLISDANGTLRITQEQDFPVVATLEEGTDFLKFSMDDDDTKRYSRITVLGQEVSFIGSGAAEAITVYGDTRRYRPLIILADNAPAGPSLQDRADYELRVREGIGFRVEVEVASWGPNENSLWKLGDSVRVSSTSANLDDDLLISGVTFILSENKKLAKLTFARQGSFSILKAPPKDIGGWS